MANRTFPKARLHKLLWERGLDIPQYSRECSHADNVAHHTSTATLVVYKRTYTGSGEGGNPTEADGAAAGKLLEQVQLTLRGIPKRVHLRDGKGSYKSQYQRGEYASALVGLCQSLGLEAPVVEDKAQIHRQYTGGNSAGRMGSTDKKKHHVVVQAGGIERSCTHHDKKIAVQTASKAIYDELLRSRQE